MGGRRAVEGSEHGHWSIRNGAERIQSLYRNPHPHRTEVLPGSAVTLRHRSRMKTLNYFLSAGAIAAGLIGQSAIASSSEPTSEQLEFFEKKVRPLFIERCYNCHSADT